MRSHLLALVLMVPMATLVAQESPLAPMISFHLGWSPKGTCAKPKGQRIYIASIKVDGQMEERGHWRKYYFNALNELPSCREELQKAFAALLTAKGFTVVDDPEVPTYEAVIYISEADTSGSPRRQLGMCLSDNYPRAFKGARRSRCPYVPRQFEATGSQRPLQMCRRR